MDNWPPAVALVSDGLAGGGGADVGCVTGSSIRPTAHAYPGAQITGSAYHNESIRVAKTAGEPG